MSIMYLIPAMIIGLAAVAVVSRLACGNAKADSGRQRLILLVAGGLLLATMVTSITLYLISEMPGSSHETEMRKHTTISGRDSHAD